jgi:hypothetical protein
MFVAASLLLLISKRYKETGENYNGDMYVCPWQHVCSCIAFAVDKRYKETGENYNGDMYIYSFSNGPGPMGQHGHGPIKHGTSPLSPTTTVPVPGTTRPRPMGMARNLA